MFSWQRGRSGGGYEKLTIFDFTWPVRWDMHLIRVPAGCHIAPHKDPVKGKRHWRLNLVLRRARSGGEFVSEFYIINWTRLKLFRPDISLHSITPVEAGERLCLSIGLAVS